MSINEIYFHASEFETVGLPLYEAQELGLKVVAPIKPYSFDTHLYIKYLIIHLDLYLKN